MRDHAGDLAPAGTPDGETADIRRRQGDRSGGAAERLAGVTARVEALPQPVRDMASRGLKKAVDHQDLAYGSEYLDRPGRAVALDGSQHGHRMSIWNTRQSRR
jgi:indolepyruvate ferredoxin oxidoreductase, beta subunit